LAAPTLHDPNFEHSVVLLGRAGGDGALGWVINGRELMSVRELLASSELLPQGREIPETASFAAPVRLGGPVAPAAGWLIYRRDDKPLPGKWRSDPRSPSPESWRPSRRSSEAKAPPPSSCCWAAPAGRPGQLEGEISAGSWLPTSVRPNLVLDATVVSAWDEAYHETVGADPAAFTSQRGKAVAKGPSNSRGHDGRRSGPLAASGLRFRSSSTSVHSGPATRAAQPRQG